MSRFLVLGTQYRGSGMTGTHEDSYAVPRIFTPTWKVVLGDQPWTLADCIHS